MRKYDLDHIRWGTIVLVLIYHVFYLLNGVGVLGGVGSFRETQYQDAFLYVVYPWFMVLLFLVAGISARYALCHRTAKQFIKERTTKLLVPATLGLFVFQWLVGYFNLKVSGVLTMIPMGLRYPVMVLSGVGPLWFVQLLWIFSLLLVLIRKLDAKDRLYTLCGRCTMPVLLLLVLPIWGASHLLNMPVITTYRFGIYFLAFLLGYFVFSHDAVQETVAKMHLPMLVLALGMAVFYVWYFFGQNYAEAACLQHIFTNVYLWTAVLAILGCGRVWLNKTSRFADYMTKSCYGIYIVHYLVVLSSCYFLKTATTLPEGAVYLLAIAAVLIGSPVLYALLSRIPVLRYLILGIKKEKMVERTGN